MSVLYPDSVISIFTVPLCLQTSGCFLFPSFISYSDFGEDLLWSTGAFLEHMGIYVPPGLTLCNALCQWSFKALLPWLRLEQLLGDNFFFQVSCGIRLCGILLEIILLFDFLPFSVLPPSAFCWFYWWAFPWWISCMWTFISGPASGEVDLGKNIH